VILVVSENRPDLTALLDHLRDSRMRFLTVSDATDWSHARSAGASIATGEWIAFLNHDDEWHPNKLEIQLEAAENIKEQNMAIIASRYDDRTNGSQHIYPMRLPMTAEGLDTYLCVPRSLYSRAESLHLSTILIPRKLLLAIPLIPNTVPEINFLWIMRAGILGNATLKVVPEILSFHSQSEILPEQVLQFDQRTKWRRMYSVVRDNRLLFNAETYAYCIASHIIPELNKCREPLIFKFSLIRECLNAHSVSLRCIFLLLCRLLVPFQLRHVDGAHIRITHSLERTVTSEAKPA